MRLPSGSISTLSEGKELTVQDGEIYYGSFVGVTVLRTRR